MALTLEEAQRLDWTPSWQRLSARFPDSCASERRADWREREGNPCVERAAASIRGGRGTFASSDFGTEATQPSILVGPRGCRGLGATAERCCG